MNDRIIETLQHSVFTFPLYRHLLKEHGYASYDFLNNPKIITEAIMTNELTYIPFTVYNQSAENINIRMVCDYYEGANPIIVEYCLEIDSMNNLNRIKLCNPDFYQEHIAWRIKSLLSYEKLKS